MQQFPAMADGCCAFAKLLKAVAFGSSSSGACFDTAAAMLGSLAHEHHFEREGQVSRMERALVADRGNFPFELS
jgi:hypothetical protein